MITAFSVSKPLFDANELHPRVLLLHLGGDETCAEFV
jgi:hypothetical protein